ncbi:polysaccharide deacetylase family protein [Actimicrobium sp. GrIS 1.19]|uniref:polysaccharide deacetylase family protein n=1 Tax=Actimicrobium sp. GrIS 1.19 TaxID=3071708 RepID=UPI002E11F05D
MLKRSRQVISLAALVDGLVQQRDMSDTVAITFDDGYQNNALVAAPALADFNMSAAFFLTSGLIGTTRCIWTDRLEMLLDQTAQQSLQVSGHGLTLPLRDQVEKRRALSRLKRLFKEAPPPDIDAAILQLGKDLAVADAAASGDYHFMSWDQARALVGSGFEVGAHTVSHPILSKIAFDDARAEILVSRDRVLHETGQCSPIFCFPNGKLADFNPDLQKLCREHFIAALSTERGPAVLDDLFQLKRLSPSGPGAGENIEWMLLRAH